MHLLYAKSKTDSVLESVFAVNTARQSTVEESEEKSPDVAVEVFDCNGQYIRKHLFQKPSERAAEKLAMELKRGFASQLIQANKASR